MKHPLFTDTLAREDVLAFPSHSVEHELTIQVHRNHSFELIAPVVNVFLGLNRQCAHYVYSDYDDSVSFKSVVQEADLHLIWLDLTRYQLDDIVQWVKSRVETLQDQLTGKAPILIGLCGGSNHVNSTGCCVFSCDELFREVGIAGYDERLERYSGTRLSSQGCLQVARELGAQISSLTSPVLKGLVVDLDQTLYQGVLGEDGPEKLVPYTDVQRYLKKLSQQGFLICIASKNNADDVRKMFAVRQDFPLHWSDFAGYAIGWDSKVDGILSIAHQLNVGLDSLLFIDDNPGELLEVQLALPQVRTLAADAPRTTRNGLRWFPGLQKHYETYEDTVRRQDIQANQQRELLKKAVSREEYLEQLGITLFVEVNPAHHRVRMYELFHKTNQYVFSFLRPDTVCMEEYLASPLRSLVTVSMADKLSQSGLIALAAVRLETEGLHAGWHVDEIVISCRALGRGIDQEIVLTMLNVAKGTMSTTNSNPAERFTTVCDNCSGWAQGQACLQNFLPHWYIHYKRGPRNTPGIEALERLSGDKLGDKGTVLLSTLPCFELPFVTVHAPDF